MSNSTTRADGLKLHRLTGLGEMTRMFLMETSYQKRMDERY